MLRLLKQRKCIQDNFNARHQILGHANIYCNFSKIYFSILVQGPYFSKIFSRNTTLMYDLPIAALEKFVSHLHLMFNSLN